MPSSCWLSIVIVPRTQGIAANPITDEVHCPARAKLAMWVDEEPRHIAGPWHASANPRAIPQSLPALCPPSPVPPGFPLSSLPRPGARVTFFELTSSYRLTEVNSHIDRYCRSARRNGATPAIPRMSVRESVCRTARSRRCPPASVRKRSRPSPSLFRCAPYFFALGGEC